MNKFDVVRRILNADSLNGDVKKQGQAFAPSNIALCKYWGKRDTELNLPVTSSLSVSLGNKGAFCRISCLDQASDTYILNHQPMDIFSPFGQRLYHYLNMFRTQQNYHFEVDIQMNLPFAAGLASSACGFAALALGLNDLFSWKLNPVQLSILARLGSGSACRSIEPGFVEWQAGSLSDGMDSYGQVLEQRWPAFRIGLHMVNQGQKPLSSSQAMAATVASSSLYATWPKKAAEDLGLIKKAIINHDFELLGRSAESNALTMHALMLSAWPPISYTLSETVAAMHKIWRLRQQGLPIYFTQDAGPNLKLLFLEQDQALLCEHFPEIEMIQPF